MLRIEVVYAEPDAQPLIRLELAVGSTVADALRHSGIFRLCPALEDAQLPLGIFGRRVTPETLLCDGDRVEIYRALKVDPKEARRRRAGSRARRSAPR